MAWTFTTLLIGFILLALGHFGMPIMKVVADCEIDRLCASYQYMMGGIIINDLAGKTVLPMGKKWVK